MTLGRFGLRRRQYEFPPYRPPSEADSLLLEGLEVTSEFLSDHISNLIPLYGKLPEAQETMIQTLTEALDRLKRDEGWRETLALQRYLTHL